MGELIDVDEGTAEGCRESVLASRAPGLILLVFLLAATACKEGPVAKRDEPTTSLAEEHSTPPASASASASAQPPDACATAWDCYLLGRKYRSGKAGFARDSQRAFEIFGRACSLTKGSDDTGCREQAFMLREGEGIPQDEASALGMYTAMCDRGSGGQCNSAARILSKPRQVGRDDAAALVFRKRATELLESGCERNSGRDCNSLGYMHFEKEIPGASMKAAADAFQKSCARKYAPGCDSYGFMVLNGAGVAKSEEDAFRHFTVGCNSDVGYSCIARGFMLHFGRGTTADEPAAAAAFAKGCSPLVFVDSERNCQRNQDPSSCGMAALMAAMGVCTSKDTDKARALSKVACPAPYTWYCERVKDTGK